MGYTVIALWCFASLLIIVQCKNDALSLTGKVELLNKVSQCAEAKPTYLNASIEYVTIFFASGSRASVTNFIKLNRT